jgi:hypothetical protein
MKFSYLRSAVLGALLIFGATQALAADCVMTVTRTACSPDKEKESFSKCKGKASCDEIKKVGSLQACKDAAIVACLNKKDRWKSTKLKTVTAKFGAEPVEGGKNLCDNARDGLDKCNATE